MHAAFQQIEEQATQDESIALEGRVEALELTQTPVSSLFRGAPVGGAIHRLPEIGPFQLRVSLLRPGADQHVGRFHPVVQQPLGVDEQQPARQLVHGLDVGRHGTVVQLPPEILQ